MSPFRYGYSNSVVYCLHMNKLFGCNTLSDILKKDGLFHKQTNIRLRVTLKYDQSSQ